MKIDALWVVNRCVDILFFGDLIINFFVGFYDVLVNTYVFDHSRIVSRCAKP